jgi:hypothetical protein
MRVTLTPRTVHIGALGSFQPAGDFDAADGGARGDTVERAGSNGSGALERIQGKAGCTGCA